MVHIGIICHGGYFYLCRSSSVSGSDTWYRGERRRRSRQFVASRGSTRGLAGTRSISSGFVFCNSNNN